MDAIIEEKKQQVLAQREAAARQEQADRERKQAEEERQNLAKAKKRAEEERVRKEAERAEHKQRREQEEREQHERKARELGAKRKADMHVVSEALIAASTVKEVDRESKAEESPEPSWGQIVKNVHRDNRLPCNLRRNPSLDCGVSWSCSVWAFETR
jgi:hypothetical protein